MKGYEGRYDCEYETQEEGAGKHSEKITNRVEKGGGVEGVSCTRLVVGDGTRRKITKCSVTEQKEARSIIKTEVKMSVTEKKCSHKKYGLLTS